MFSERSELKIMTFNETSEIIEFREVLPLSLLNKIMKSYLAISCLVLVLVLAYATCGTNAANNRVRIFKKNCYCIFTVLDTASL